MVIVTYFCRGNPLSPHRLLFPISSKRSFICTFPQTGQHIPQPLVDQLWTTDWNEKKPKLQMLQTGSIQHAGGSKPLQQSVLSPELRPAPPKVALFGSLFVHTSNSPRRQCLGYEIIERDVKLCLLGFNVITTVTVASIIHSD